MDAKAKSIASSNAPWRRGIGWPIVLIEGLALLGVGIYALVATDSARSTIYALFGLILAGNGAAAAFAALRGEPDKSTAYRGLRGGVSLTTGLLALLNTVSDTLDRGDARIILGFGFVAVSVIGLASLFLGRREATFPVASLVWQAVMLVLGVMLLTGSEESTSRMELLGWVVTIFGALLIAFAVYLRQAAAPGSPAAAASPAS